MRARYLVIGLVLVLATVTGVLVYQGNQSQTAGSSTVIVTQTTTAGADSSSSDPYARDTAGATDSTAVPIGDLPPTNVPMTKLAPGDKAPQFIIFSFDGAGSHERWNEFMAAAEETNSRFTGFLSGIYLLGQSGKDAGAYTGPGHATGKASIGYGDTEPVIITEVNDLNLAYSKGHEIGTHYNGHFCDDNPPGGNQWNTADWNNELDQFFTFMRDWKTLNGYTDAPDLTVPIDTIKGGRTPCLTGNLEDLIPAWKAHNLTYDSSIPAPYTGIAWPALKDGIWEFYMPTVYSPGFASTLTAMSIVCCAALTVSGSSSPSGSSRCPSPTMRIRLPPILTTTPRSES